MKVKTRFALPIAFALVAAAIPMASASHWEPSCPHASPHSHTYGSGGSVGGRSETVFGPRRLRRGPRDGHRHERRRLRRRLRPVGGADDVALCAVEGRFPCCPPRLMPWCLIGETADFDGDYDSGAGGGFFGFGPWAHEAVCDFGLTLHGGTVTVNDVVWGGAVQFVVGADDQNGPDLTPDPVTSEPACTTDGSITPGDPATDPTADADDCLSQVYTGSGATCGAGGDGGYWVFLDGLFASEGPGGVGVNNAPTTGTITA